MAFFTAAAQERPWRAQPCGPRAGTAGQHAQVRQLRPGRLLSKQGRELQCCRGPGACWLREMMLFPQENTGSLLLGIHIRNTCSPVFVQRLCSICWEDVCLCWGTTPRVPPQPCPARLAVLRGGGRGQGLGAGGGLCWAVPPKKSPG